MGTISPPQKGHSPRFLAHVCCGQTAGRIKMALGTEVGLGPGQIVLHADPALPRKGAQHRLGHWSEANSQNFQCIRHRVLCGFTSLSYAVAANCTCRAKSDVCNCLVWLFNQKEFSFTECFIAMCVIINVNLDLSCTQMSPSCRDLLRLGRCVSSLSSQ